MNKIFKNTAIVMSSILVAKLAYVLVKRFTTKDNDSPMFNCSLKDNITDKVKKGILPNDNEGNYSKNYNKASKSIEKLQNSMAERLPKAVSNKVLTREELEVMTVKELNIFAEKENITLAKSLKKAERIDEILKAQRN